MLRRRPAAGVAAPAWLDRIMVGDASKGMAEIPDASVDLVITSPPYNVSKSYADHADNLPWTAYMLTLQRTDPIVRNAQEVRQLAMIEDYLTKKGYRKQGLPSTSPLNTMQPGTFSFRMNVSVNVESRVVEGVVVEKKTVNMPIDVVIQPKTAKTGDFPILIEAKSAGDYTNTNKRRKEDATKIHQLRATYGPDVQLHLFLCGYFDSGYLGYEAAEGLDWIWEHRISDMDQLGI